MQGIPENRVRPYQVIPNYNTNEVLEHCHVFSGRKKTVVGICARNNGTEHDGLYKRSTE
jgi:hypothetical protein